MLSYRDEAQKLMTGLKYRNRRSPIRWLARELVRAIQGFHPDCITWVPGSGQGSKERGFAPGKLLAREIAHTVGVPAVRLLQRADNVPQTSRSLAGRLEGPEIRSAKYYMGHRRVLLVDDVCTTGTSLAKCAEVLSQFGVNEIKAAVAAITPAS